MNGLPEYLRGAADLHVHSSPDVVPRRFDDIELAREAARGGFGALLLKNHMVPTMDRAYLVQKIVPEIAVHGGIVLNDSVGGFNRVRTCFPKQIKPTIEKYEATS